MVLTIHKEAYQGLDSGCQGKGTQNSAPASDDLVTAYSQEWCGYNWEHTVRESASWPTTTKAIMCHAWGTPAPTYQFTEAVHACI